MPEYQRGWKPRGFQSGCHYDNPEAVALLLLLLDMPTLSLAIIKI